MQAEMENFLKNLAAFFGEKIEQFIYDFFDFPTLLSLTMAVIAGYYFQSRYVQNFVNSESAARLVAVFACITFAVVMKYTLLWIDDIKFLSKGAIGISKAVLGVAISIVAFYIESSTSNSSIEDRKTNLLADRIESKFDLGRIDGLKASKAKHEHQFAYFDSLEKATGKIFVTQKNKALAGISQYETMIAQAEADKIADARKADGLRMATVIDAGSNKMQNSYFGTFLLVLAIGVEIVAPTHRRSATSGITLTTTKTTHSASLTVWARDENGWRTAISALTREKNLGNGVGMLSLIAGHFHVNKGVVCRAVKLAQSGEPINVPKKLLQTNG